MLYFSYYFHLKLKDEAMKVNVLLIFFATMGILCADGMAGDDSGITRDIHGQQKNCVPCHGGKAQQAIKDQPNPVIPVPEE
jgi:hypothetical protein